MYRIIYKLEIDRQTIKYRRMGNLKDIQMSRYEKLIDEMMNNQIEYWIDRLIVRWRDIQINRQKGEELRQKDR